MDLNDLMKFASEYKPIYKIHLDAFMGSKLSDVISRLSEINAELSEKYDDIKIVNIDYENDMAFGIAGKEKIREEI
jgi:hypothetical protein